MPGSLMMYPRAPGFQRTILSRSLSTPGRYIRGTMWDSLEASNAALGSAELRAFAAANPEAGIFTSSCLEGYELVHGLGDPLSAATLGFQSMVEWTLTGGQPGMLLPLSKAARSSFRCGRSTRRVFCWLGSSVWPGPLSGTLWCGAIPAQMTSGPHLLSPKSRNGRRPTGPVCIRVPPPTPVEVYEVVQRIVR